MEHFLVLIGVLGAAAAVDGFFEVGLEGFESSEGVPLRSMAACLRACAQDCSERERTRDLGVPCFLECHDSCKEEEATTKGRSDSQDPKTDSNQHFSDQNHCLNGKNPSQLTLKDNLIEFAKGKCSPVILVPDFMGTKLVVKITCEKLRLNNPSLFRTCGWNACRNPDSDFTLNIPKPEYVIWIPDRLSPMSVFSQYEHTGLCFAGLLKTTVDFGAVPEEIVRFQPGVSVEIFGSTPGTKADDSCRANSVQHIWVESQQKPAAKGFASIIQALEAQGYVSGLTYQVLPFNPLKSIQYNEFRTGLFMTLARFKMLTGKRTTLVGHGYGRLWWAMDSETPTSSST
jgi:hypothetical protein